MRSSRAFRQGYDERMKSGGSGVGFVGLLAVLFVGLKLTGYITWSWWWVLSPLWIPWAIVLGLFIVVGFIYGIYKIFLDK
jgi:hypothetical protein